MLSIEMRAIVEQNIELTSIGILTSIGHGEQTSARVFHNEVLIFELAAIDGFSITTVFSGDFTTLSHEAWDDSMKMAPLEMKRPPRFTIPLLSSAQCSKVLSCQRGSFNIELEYNTSGAAPNIHVKEDLRVYHLKFSY